MVTLYSEGPFGKLLQNHKQEIIRKRKVFLSAYNVPGTRYFTYITLLNP